MAGTWKKTGRYGLWIIAAVLIWLCAAPESALARTGSSYPIQQPPQKRESGEIGKKIKEFAAQYPEFQEIYDNLDLYPENLLEALCNNPEMIDFVKVYPEADKEGGKLLTQEELDQEVPLLLQWDERWGYVTYGNEIIALSGCAPACLAMVIASLTGSEEATPDRLAAEAEAGGYYIPGQGTSWTFMTEGCNRYGVKGEELTLDKDRVFEQLKEGRLVICSMKPGDFTFGGHFIVLTEVEGGRLRINDPNSIVRSGWSWDYEVLEPQIKNLWVYSMEER